MNLRRAITRSGVNEMIDNITARLRYCSLLPTIPGVALRIVELANRPDATLAEISDCVSMDPALSAKLLRMTRSPLYTTRRSATNVRQAVSLIGPHAALMIALSFSLGHTTPTSAPACQPNLHDFWRRALLSAVAARALGEKLGIKKLDDLFLAGLLQDIGILAFDAMMPGEYEKVNRATLTHDALIRAERTTFGAGHDEVGYWLLKHWKLPDYLALACLANHGLAQEQDAMSRMTSCVAVSSFIADYFLHADNPLLKNQAMQAAQTLLDMDERSLASVLDRVALRRPDMDAVFDVRLPDATATAALMKEAQDLQILRQLSRDAELERGALRDALTGAYNRHYFENVLEREFDLATRSQCPLSMAMIDLDQLKHVNALHGLAVGDAVLISIVRNIQSKIRPDDVLARYASERFVLIMPGATLESARHIIARLQESIAAVDHTQERGKPIKITVSIGMVAHMDEGIAFDRSDALVDASEAALLQAQHEGTNRMSVWSRRA